MMKLEMMEKTLQDLFTKHRIVFWYDDKKDLREAFEALSIPDIEKVEMNGNEFAIKHLLLLEKPDQKILVYQAGEKPPAEENWMLDLLYCCGEFRTDKCSIVLHELDLNSSFSHIYSDHQMFFVNDNKEKLKQRILAYKQSGEVLTDKLLLMTMLSICCKADNARLDTILHELFSEYAREKNDAYKAIEKAKLEPFLWEQIHQYYGFHSKVPKIKDFLYHVFKSTLEKGVGKTTDLKQDSVALLHSFRDLQKYREDFQEVSQQCCKDLQLWKLLQTLSLDQLGSLDYCMEIDQRIIEQLLDQVLKEVIPFSTIQDMMKKRQLSVWFSTFEPAYQALEAAGKFFELLHTLKFTCSSFAGGIENYSKNWYQIDLCYRQYYTFLKKVPSEEQFSSLTTKIENYYIVQYLIPLHESWEKQLKAVTEWKGTLQYPLQKNFYRSVVEEEFSNTRNLKHLVVIISDALRYEAGHQLCEECMQLSKIKASITPIVSQLPSYTQLGMAALLPGGELEMDSKGNVLLDNQPTSGIENRKQHLQKVDGVAIHAEEFIGFSTQERKSFLGKHRIVYIYQNIIDAQGHKRESESRTFQAVQRAIEEILNMVTRLTSAGRNNIIVTSDHGFLYRQSELTDTDYNTETPSDPTIFYKDRRFVLATSFPESSSYIRFTGDQLGIKGGFEAAFPKSITRFRLQGSCSRFVHGGTSLQEIVIPVVKINYNTKREGPADVEFNMDASTSTIISTSTLSLTFSQMEAIDSTLRPVQIKVEIHAKNGECISDSREIVFDSESEQFNQRRKTITLTLSSAADQHNNEPVYVVIMKRVHNASLYTEEKRIEYTLKRTFTQDF
jgi:uncharacterized protein (TIGR02687 family)